MQNTAATTTDRAEQLEAQGFTGEEDYAQHHEILHKARQRGEQVLRDTRAAGGLEYVHLSETGVHAGRRLCLAPRSENSRSVHAVYAPLHNPTFLASVCKDCLDVWAIEAYEDGDEIPEYLIDVRAAAKLGAANAQAKGEDVKGGQ